MTKTKRIKVLTRTNLQNTTQTNKDWATRIPLKTGVNSGGQEGIKQFLLHKWHPSYSSLVTYPMISQEFGLGGFFFGGGVLVFFATQLYVRFDNLPTCRKYLHDLIISLVEEIEVHKASLTPPLFIECLYQARIMSEDVLQSQLHVHVYIYISFLLMAIE